MADWLGRSRAADRAQSTKANEGKPFQQRGPLNMNSLLTALIKAYEIQGGLQKLNSLCQGCLYSDRGSFGGTDTGSCFAGLPRCPSSANIPSSFYHGPTKGLCHWWCLYVCRVDGFTNQQRLVRCADRSDRPQMGFLSQAVSREEI